MAEEKKAKALSLFLEAGFDKKRAEETLRNAQLTEALSTVITEAKAVEGVDMKNVVNHLYTVASTLSPQAVVHRSALVKYVATGKVGKINLSAALNYLKKLGSDPLDVSDFENQCGIGVVITREDVKKAVASSITENLEEIKKERYRFPVKNIMDKVRDNLKWANPLDIKEETDVQLKALLGEKTEEDSKPVPKKKEKETKEVAKTAEGEVIKELIVFPDPKENKQLKPSLLENHLKATGGVVVCRFPPEPNGYLHIGHAKAMNLNFSYPKKSGGWTYLRFDDTNPEAESEEYINSIIHDVKWMGHNPKSINFSSDYFPQLYDMAVQLIKEGKAYICHQTKEEMKRSKEAKEDSPWRNRPIEESLKLFEDMRKGKFAEGEAMLRLKMNMKSDNPCMRDLVAYRIKYAPHPHVGDKWVVYPTYDYTHCIIDSLENITHSLCTLEFLPRRESYYWLVDALRIYRPLVWEYSRLNITNTVLSKRKLIKLVKEGRVRGWDDPRMPTISGLRRRGYTADAINTFCDKVGVTTHDNIINYNLLEQCVRDDLDVRADRAMVVVEPLKVTLTNWTGKKDISIPKHPKETKRGNHDIPLTNVLYIERNDFRENETPGYKRLTPKQPVGLSHVPNCIITVTDVVKDGKGEVSELKATIDFESKQKPKGYIHWVSPSEPAKEPLAIEVRLYDHLFNSADVAALGDEWRSDINKGSLVVVVKCFGDSSISGAKAGDHRQFERVGYFVVDGDSTPEKMVWNRTVTLKESKWEGKKGDE